MDFLKILILFGVGIVAGFINVIAGGGSSLTLPALIFMGLGSTLANGTNRLAVLIQNISAVASFSTEKFHHFKVSLLLSLLTLPGAVAGALLAEQVSDLLFKRILAAVLIFIIFSMFFSYPQRKNHDKPAILRRLLSYPAMLGVGFYGGFIQVGVGFVLMAVLYHLLEFNLVLINMHKVFIIMVYTVPVLLVFALTGNINWTYGLILAAGNALGAWWGARVAVKGGEKVIRIILAVAIIAIAIKLVIK